MSEQEYPNPGSDAARDMGCRCPVLDNNHGRGKGPFWMVESCPLHGVKPREAANPDGVEIKEADE